MKIVIKNPEPFRVYHHPCDVIIHPSIKKVEIYDGSKLTETFDLIEKSVEWITNSQNDTEELLLTITVHHN